MGGAQVPRHDVHHADLAAVRIEDQQFLDARAGHAGAKFHPQCHHRLRRQSQRAGETDVFRAQADLLGWQNQHWQIGRQVGQGRLNHAVDQIGIHTQGQMWAVLLDGGHRQNSDGFVDVVAYGQLRELAGRQVGPESGGEGHGSILTAAPGRAGPLFDDAIFNGRGGCPESNRSQVRSCCYKLSSYLRFLHGRCKHFLCLNQVLSRGSM